MGVQRDSAALGRVVVVDSEIPEGGWMSVDLTGLTPATVGAAAPSAGWNGMREPWLAEAAPHPQHRDKIRQPAKQPLTIARLEAWAERLRAPGKPTADSFPPVAAEPIVGEAPAVEEPASEPRPLRGIRPEDLVAVRRKPAEPPAIPDPTGPESQVPSKPLARPALRIVAGRPRFSLGGVPSSSGVRFILLCIAAFFLSAGAMHSYGRWKHSRAIVVPVSITPGAVIT